MNPEETPQKETREIQPAPSRPFLLTAICLFAYVFYGVLSLLFLISLFYSGKISAVVMQYAPEQAQHKSSVFFFIIAGFVLHALAFSGILVIWRLRRTGFLIFGLSALLIATYQLFLDKIPIGPVALNITLIFLTGLFYKKYR